MTPLDESAGGVGSMLAVGVVLLTTTIALRLTARAKQKTRFGPDDWLMIPVWLLFIGITVVGCIGMAHGWIGYPAPHDPKILAVTIPQLALLYWNSNLFSIISIGLIRLSALFFYRRIFCTQNRKDWFYWVNAIFIGIVSLWTIAYALEEVFICGVHVSEAWTSPQLCTTYSYPWLTGWAISSFLLDVLILSMPMPKIWSLHTSIERKLSICLVFLVALGGLGASCARMVNAIKLWKTPPAANFVDPYETNTTSYYYVTLEVALCGVAANLPSLWYFRSSVDPSKILRSMRSMVTLRSTEQRSTDKSYPLTDQSSADPSLLKKDSMSSSVRDEATHRDKLESKTSVVGYSHVV